MLGMRRLVNMILVLACALFVSGMSGLTDDVPRRIPTPEQNYSATVVDQADVHTKLTMFSIAGYTLFLGKKGKGQLAVPFNRIKRAELRIKDDILEAILLMKEGHSIILTADRRQECFGRTKFGNFKIKLGDIKMFTIDGLIPAAEGVN